MKLIYYRALNTIGLILVLVTNYLANALPINGYSTGELSSFYPNLFVPAGITFSIWGIIYLLLIIFIIMQWKTSNDNVVKNLGTLFFMNCLLDTSWILVWHYRYEELSVLIMLGLLTNLISIYLRLGNLSFNSVIDKFIVKTPFNIYFGWICVATIANITTLLVHWEFSPAYPEYWTIAMIMVTPVLVFLVNRKGINLFYTATIIWALSGIAYKRSMEGGPEVIMIACYVAIALAASSYFIRLAQRKFS
ncbi:tryptophan-rich sensory protein [Fulvivirga lutea]|uniref:Tryptophan-rich sensory protein n=1 Tax=Fulvivirga lutea TaxID=2810512 RepID=A0A974WFJ9_9BACT|nr:tryptophan-rich sensory protein [Fulvivirga lutea]QSE97543.1 hypothetical protein JR347_00190 [Fulvivirga lutea]